MTDLSNLDSPKHPKIPKLEKILNEDLSREGLDFEFLEEDKILKELTRIDKTILKNTELDGHPLRSNVDKLTNNLISNAEKLKKFNPKQDDPAQIRQSIQNMYSNFLREETQYKGVMNLYLRKKLEEGSLTGVEAYKEELENEIVRLNSIASELTSKSKEELTTEYSNTFEEQAKKHSKFSKGGIGQAQWYLVLAILLSAGLVFCFDWIFGTFESHVDNFQDFQKAYDGTLATLTFSHFLIYAALKKLIVLGLLLFGIRFAFKQYSINKHLHVLNKHRANSLKSFDLLFNNLEKREHREKFLIDIANIIYDPKETGYSLTNKGDRISLLDSLNIGNNKGGDST